MANNVLLRQGTGEEMNKTLEELYNATLNDFGNINIRGGFAKSNGEIVAGARKVITGINVAQYFMVEPSISELLEVLPKPVAKEVFEKICKGIGTNIAKFYERGEANNALDTAIYHNREILRKLVQKIAMEHFGWTKEDFIRIFGRNFC